MIPPPLFSGLRHDRQINGPGATRPRVIPKRTKAWPQRQCEGSGAGARAHPELEVFRRCFGTVEGDPGVEHHLQVDAKLRGRIAEGLGSAQKPAISIAGACSRRPCQGLVADSSRAGNSQNGGCLPISLLKVVGVPSTRCGQFFLGYHHQ
ncbi:hypothetical protein LX32DRAFT_302723 [Colletotrichum zoysiae]|uniref:Uncharacterized protein n=1 Tax=Colletotrichum zoysiae TaxID=1216348 RepID=A0AAD9HMY3_9PEZI|nr:hypothetical protein LX32DRAFT_302723 [Colletotrichum zoysiae]